MAVAVAGPDRRQGEARTLRRQERRLLVVAAVMRNLQQVDGVTAGLEQVDLRLRLDIAGEQGGEAGRPQAQHERAVVGVRAGPSIAPARGLDRPPDGPELALLTERCLRDGDTGGAGPGEHLGVLGGRLRERSDLDEPDGSTQHAWQTEHVVGVLVGEDHERDAVDPEPVEAAIGGNRIGTDVDDQATAGDDHVALADITHHHHPVRRRPGRCGSAEADGHEAAPHQAGRHDPSQPAMQHRDPADRRQHRQQQRTSGAVRPVDRGSGNLGAGAGDPHEPRRR